MKMTQKMLNFQRIEKAITYLESNFKHQPDLDQVAEQVHLSQYHFQRLFQDWVGLSPKHFLQYITLDYLKSKIQETQNMMEAAELAGLSGQSRVHDLFVNIEGVTPQQFKSFGEGLQIYYGYHATPFGMCFIAVAERGICRLHFIDEENKRDEYTIFSRQWNSATLIHDPEVTQQYVSRIFNKEYNSDNPMKVLVRGTNFQVKVWEGLLKIPYGSVATFAQLAKIVQTNSIRSLASAVGKNPIPFLIPCHRIITKEGEMGDYHWGRVRKKLILGSELAGGDAAV
jgi:AraC family transcriptional regulator, regulatory protein of adaptative response / methylated-DNA-[protein]-cysteine methyltransferase